jgi:hypothetical protein
LLAGEYGCFKLKEEIFNVGEMTGERLFIANEAG